jgi:acetyl esterase
VVSVADVRAWLMQKTAPVTVRYGRELEVGGQDLPEPRRFRVPTRHGTVRCRVHLPPGVTSPAVHVHLHGGAFVMRYPQMDDFFARFLVVEAGVAVVAVDYSVAPQVRYPVAQEQVHDVAAHLSAHGVEGTDVDGGRLSIGGFSAGGNLAASACLQARDRGTLTPRFQLLGVPSLDVAEEYADKRPVGTPMLGPGILDLVRATYFQDAERRTEPYASPLRAESLAGLPPTMVVTGEVDLLRREGDAYARRLTEAGVAVDHRVVPGADHYFLHPGNARAEMGRMADAVRRHLA